ncbi:hypothetical protein [Serratia odorifera]|uniref:hypothetical protein n=1 Tax=Serratia odorifera TaxID=618 RepID=UPI00235FAC1D|nr:hypothetical protein [Serratia odorifera]
MNKNKFIQERWNREINNFQLLHIANLQEILTELGNSPVCTQRQFEDFVNVYEWTLSEYEALYASYEYHAEDIAPTPTSEATTEYLMGIRDLILQLHAQPIN